MTATVKAKIVCKNLFLRIFQFYSFNPFIFDGAAHERLKCVGVDRTFSRRQKTTITVISNLFINFDTLEKSDVSGFIYNIRRIHIEFPLSQPDRRLQTRQRSLFIKKKHHLFAFFISRSAFRRNIHIDITVLHFARLD